MAKNKTLETASSVEDFIFLAVNVQRQKDSFELLKLMQEITGSEAKMWGPSIIGFGKYHYRYASGHEGVAPILGFSPRKAAISLYIYSGLEDHKYLLENLGKFKMGKACIYVNKLSDLNHEALITLMRTTVQHTNLIYGKV